MLFAIMAAAVATAEPAPAAHTDKAVPARADPHRKPRRDDIICKTVQLEGIGVTKQACVTRGEWEENEAITQRNLRQMQVGNCGRGC